MRHSLEPITAETWRVTDPAGFSDQQARDFATLAAAEITILMADHFVHYCRQLVTPGRRLGCTWLYAPLRGAIDMTLGKQRWTIRANEFALIPAGMPHNAIALTRRLDVVTIHLRIRLQGAMPDQLLFRNPVLRLPDPAAWHRRLDWVVSLERAQSRAQSGVPILRYLLMDLASHGEPLRPIRADKDPRIARALSLMQQGAESLTPLKDIRQQAGLSRSHFTRLFRQACGLSPTAYYNDLRIQGVLSLLRAPELSIKEIAARRGYYDAQHLEKDFKAKFGMPLGAFRKKKRLA